MVELLIAFVITGLIVVPLSEATIFFLRHSSDASAQYSDDNGLRLVNNYFTRDVQSATAVVAPDAAACGAAVGQSALMTFTWTENAVAKQASWFVETSNGQQSFVRRRCSGASVDETNAIAPVSGTPTVTCSPSCAAPASVRLVFNNLNGLGASLTARKRVSP